MSIAETIADMRRELSVLKTATCEIRTAVSGWVANPSSRVKCHYEAVSPQAGAHLDYEGGNGYGYTVWFDEPVSVDVNDEVVIVDSPIAADIGMELQVQQVPPRSNNGPVPRVDAVKR